MRIIGTLPHENQARKLGQYLTSQGIVNSCEPSFNALNGQMSYEIWIHDEDQIGEAARILQEFELRPSDPKFEVSLPEPEPTNPETEPPPAPGRFKTPITHFFLFLSALVFFLNAVQELPLAKEGLSDSTFFMTPIQASLMYDLPAPFEQVEKMIESYALTDQKLQNIPPALQVELAALEKTPYWHGLYDWVVAKIEKKDTSLDEGPLFGRILQGEIWRLFTPSILHLDLLHILFNMLWLWYLGRPIEQRIGPVRTLLLTLVAGILTNTLQYLMSGPFFIGYSGIITTLAGFIWMREKIAPWEGYPLSRATLLFLFFFIGAIFLLQLVSFFLQIFTSLHFTPNIANTAHIAGALLGIFLARFHFFAQKVR